MSEEVKVPKRDEIIVSIRNEADRKIDLLYCVDNRRNCTYEYVVLKSWQDISNQNPVCSIRLTFPEFADLLQKGFDFLLSRSAEQAQLKLVSPKELLCICGHSPNVHVGPFSSVCRVPNCTCQNFQQKEPMDGEEENVDKQVKEHVKKAFDT